MTGKCHHCQRRYEYQRATSRFCSARCRVAAFRKRKRRSVHFRSDSPEWETPQRLFDGLDREFGFDVDVCATESNAKCQRFYSPEVDGLAQHWAGGCWMNPPYGRTIGRWVRKAWESAGSGATVVCLLPARTDTAWWHEYVNRATEIRFLRGRLKFNGAGSAPFPSAVVVFQKGRVKR